MLKKNDEVQNNNHSGSHQVPQDHQPLPPLSRIRKIYRFVPGLLVCGVIALASTFLSEHYGGPLLLYALLIGLAFHFLNANPEVKPGVDFCNRSVLRAGVALLGMRITVDQVMHLGFGTALVTFFSLLLTILLGVFLARMLGRTRDEGLLSGGSVAICGASAAMAISAVLPQTKENQRFTLLAVVTVTVLSTLAMIVYPLLIRAIDLPAGQAGVFLGATIHDVAQVVAAGMMMGPKAGDVATVVKLFRVMLLVPVVMVISFIYREHSSSGDKNVKIPLIPGFLLVFLGMVLLASSGQIPAAWVNSASDMSRVCLVLAIAGAGIKTSLQDLLEIGWQPLLLFVGETLFIGAFALSAILILGLAS